MKSKIYLIFVLTLVLVFGLSLEVFAQVIDTVGSFTGGSVTTRAFGSVANRVSGLTTPYTDFSGYQGTAGDSASHWFSVSIDLAGANTTCDTIKIYFPKGFKFATNDSGLATTHAGFDTLALLKDVSSGVIYDSIRWKASIDPSGMSGDTLIIQKRSNTGGVCSTHVTVGLTLDMTIALKGIINDTSLSAVGGTVTPGLTDTTGRFYRDTLQVIAVDSAGGTATQNVFVCLQAAPATKLSLATYSNTGFVAVDTAGQRLINKSFAGQPHIDIYLRDKWENTLLDTAGTVTLKVRKYAGPVTDTLGTAPKGDLRRWGNPTNTALDTAFVTKPTIVAGTVQKDTAGVYRFSNLNYTGDDNIFLKISATDFALNRKVGNVISIPSGSKQLKGSTPNNIVLSPLSLTLELGQISNAVTATVTDSFSNATPNDSVVWKNDLLTINLLYGTYYTSEGPLYFYFSKTFPDTVIDVLGITGISAVKIQAGSIVGSDKIHATVFDANSAGERTAKYLAVWNTVKDSITITINPGPISVIDLAPVNGDLVVAPWTGPGTPVLNTLGNSDRYRYIVGARQTSLPTSLGTDESRGAVIVGDTVVFWVRTYDAFGNQKDVETGAVLDSIYMKSKNWGESSRAGDVVQNVWYKSSGLFLDPQNLNTTQGRNYYVAKFYYVPNTATTIPDTDTVMVYGRNYVNNPIVNLPAKNVPIMICAGPPYKVFGWNTKGSPLAGTTAGNRVHSQNPSAVLDTIEVADFDDMSPYLEVQAMLQDYNSKWADTLQSTQSKVTFALETATSDDPKRGTPGFIHVIRAASDDTTLHKNTSRINVSNIIPRNLADTTAAYTKFIADSAKGTVTIKVSFGSTKLGSLKLFKQPQRDVAEISATIATSDPVVTSLPTATSISDGFFAGASREVFVQIIDRMKNTIEPDSFAAPKWNVPKYQNNDMMSKDSLKWYNKKSSLGSFTAAGDTILGGLKADKTPDLMSNSGYYKTRYKSLGGVFGTDTLYVRYFAGVTPYGTRVDSLYPVVISLPAELHHFVYTVATTAPLSSDTLSREMPAGTYHTIMMEPMDSNGYPIYAKRYKVMTLQLIPPAGVSIFDTSKAIPNFVTKKPVVHWAAVSAITLRDSIDGIGLSVGTAGADTLIDLNFAVVSVAATKAMNNAKVAVTVLDTHTATPRTVYDTLGIARTKAGGVSIIPKLLTWTPNRVDTIEVSLSGTLAEQTQFKLSLVPKDIFKNRIPDTTYIVSVAASDIGVTGIDNPILVKDSTTINVSVDHQTSLNFLAVASGVKETNVSRDFRGFTPDIPIIGATINAPASLTAGDNPGDGSGYILLSFPASTNHPGAWGTSNTVDDNLAIDYYQVYRSLTNDLTKAVNWAYIVATPRTSSTGDTVRSVVSTLGGTSTAYYWVASVKGKLPPVPTNSSLAKVAASLGENVVAGIAVEASACEAKADLAVLTQDGSLISSVIGAKKARPINNNKLVAMPDLNGDDEIDISDILIVTSIYSDADNYDPVIDLNHDGTIDISDILLITNVFGQRASKDAPIKMINDGINMKSSVKLASKMNDLGDQFTLSITADQITKLGGYQFAVSYNPKDYELAMVNEGGFLASNNGNSIFIYNDKTEGKVVVAGILLNISDKNAVEGSGILATLVFKWIGEDVSAITVDNIKLMDTNTNLNTLEQQVLEKPIALPTVFNLAQNYPNPFNPETTIKYALPKNVRVELTIYNILGQKVKTLVNDEQKAGFKTVKWDGTNDFGTKVASSIYIYRLKAGDFVAQHKMVLVK
jgi:hypothetical protein